MQRFDMLHHVMGKIGLYGCIERGRGTFYLRERQFIFPEQSAVVIHKV